MRKFIVMCGIVGSLAMSAMVAVPNAAAEVGCREYGERISSSAGSRFSDFRPFKNDAAEARELACG